MTEIGVQKRVRPPIHCGEVAPKSGDAAELAPDRTNPTIDLPCQSKPHAKPVTPGGRLTAAPEVLEAATVGVRYQRHDEANRETSTQIVPDPAGSVTARVAHSLDSFGSLAATRTHHPASIKTNPDST